MNSEQIIIMILGAILNGVMLAIGMVIGTRLTTKSMMKELEKSELGKLVKKFLTSQTLTENATKFFEEATILVSSPEAKNFFKNVTELMKDLSDEEPEVKLKLPSKKQVKQVSVIEKKKN